MRWRLGYHRAFALGAQAPRGFGHYGFGGSGAFADPKRQLSVALTVNSGIGTPLGDLRIARIGGVALRCADRRAHGLPARAARPPEENRSMQDQQDPRHRPHRPGRAPDRARPREAQRGLGDRALHQPRAARAARGRRRALRDGRPRGGRLLVAAGRLRRRAPLRGEPRAEARLRPRPARERRGGGPAARPHAAARWRSSTARPRASTRPTDTPCSPKTARSATTTA